MNELSLLLNLLYIKFIQDFQGILLVLRRIQNHSKLSVVCPRFKPVTGPASKWLKHVVHRTRLSRRLNIRVRLRPQLSQLLVLGEAASANNYLSSTIFITFDVLSKLSAIIQLIISNTLNATAPGWDVQSRSLWNHSVLYAETRLCWPASAYSSYTCRAARNENLV